MDKLFSHRWKNSRRAVKFVVQAISNEVARKLLNEEKEIFKLQEIN